MRKLLKIMLLWITREKLFLILLDLIILKEKQTILIVHSLKLRKRGTGCLIGFKDLQRIRVSYYKLYIEYNNDINSNKEHHSLNEINYSKQ